MSTSSAKIPQQAETRSDRARLVSLLITVAVGAIIWFIPASEGVDIAARHLLAIFVATIVGKTTLRLSTCAFCTINQTTCL